MLVHSGQVLTSFDCSADDDSKLRGQMDHLISNKPLNNLILSPLSPNGPHLVQRFRAALYLTHVEAGLLPASLPARAV